MTVPFPRIEVLIMQKKPKCTFFSGRRKYFLKPKSTHTMPRKIMLYSNREILIEATSSQKVCETRLSTGDQGGAPIIGQ